MYKAKNDFSEPQLKCPVCGGQDFEKGRLGGQAYYIPGDSLWRLRGYQYVRIWRCLQCNHLMQFADPELSKQRNQMVLFIVILVVLLALAAIALPLLVG